MLDMGFLPEIRRIIAKLPTRRQAAPASGITQAVYPAPQDLKAALVVHLLRRNTITQALIFTRTKHRANRLADYLVQAGIRAERIHGNRSQSQRTAAMAGFKNGTFPVLVATDIAARGIDVNELGHVVNFDVPRVPDDYIHRVGRTGRAEATGEAFTFVSPEEEDDLRAIERAIARRLPRVTVPDFDYTARPQQKLEIPLAQRIAEIRRRKREDRARGELNAARRAAAVRRPEGAPPEPRPSGPARGSHGAGRRRAPGAGTLGNRHGGRGRRGRPGRG